MLSGFCRPVAAASAALIAAVLLNVAVGPNAAEARDASNLDGIKSFAVSGIVSQSREGDENDFTGQFADCPKVSGASYADESWTGSSVVKVSGTVTDPVNWIGNVTANVVSNETAKCEYFDDGGKALPSSSTTTATATYSLSSLGVSLNYNDEGKDGELISANPIANSDIKSKISETVHAVTKIMPAPANSGSLSISDAIGPNHAVVLPFNLWTLKYGTGYFSGDSGQLSVTVVPRDKPAPVANCDGYWTKPGEKISIKAPAGWLANDSNDTGKPIAIKVDQQNFATATDPYAVDPKTGAFSFDPGTSKNSRIAVLTYHLTNSVHPSNEASVQVFISPKSPSKAALASCAPVKFTDQSFPQDKAGNYISKCDQDWQQLDTAHFEAVRGLKHLTFFAPGGEDHPIAASVRVGITATANVCDPGVGPVLSFLDSPVYADTSNLTSDESIIFHVTWIDSKGGAHSSVNHSAFTFLSGEKSQAYNLKSLATEVDLAPGVYFTKVSVTGYIVQAESTGSVPISAPRSFSCTLGTTKAPGTC